MRWCHVSGHAVDPFVWISGLFLFDRSVRRAGLEGVRQTTSPPKRSRKRRPVSHCAQHCCPHCGPLLTLGQLPWSMALFIVLVVPDNTQDGCTTTNIPWDDGLKSWVHLRHLDRGHATRTGPYRKYSQYICHLIWDIKLINIVDIALILMRSFIWTWSWVTMVLKCVHYVLLLHNIVFFLCWLQKKTSLRSKQHISSWYSDASHNFNIKYSSSIEIKW